MNDVLEISRSLLYWLGWNSMYASVVFLGVALIAKLWRRLPAAVMHLCWWLVLIRLLLPVELALPVSVGSLLPSSQDVERAVVLVSWESADETVARDGGIAAAPERSVARWPAFLVALWVVGASSTFLWLWRRRRSYTTLCRDARPVEDPFILEIVDRCRSTLGVSRRVRVVHGEKAVSPFTTGIVPATIWMPTRLLEHADQTLLRCLVAHELMHVVRRDDFWIRCQLVVQSLFFFHPLAWLAGARIDRTREQACDERVIKVMNVAPADYGRSLLDTLRFNLFPTTPLAGFGAAQKRSLEMRLRALSFIPWSSRLTVLVPVIAAWLLLPMAGAAAIAEVASPSESFEAATPVDAAADEILRVGGDVKAPRVLKRVEPKYPEEARKVRAEGVVILESVIDENGRVDSVHPLKGLPYGLTEAATDAVRQWEFEPALKNGSPVKVYFNLTMNFKLATPDLTSPLPEFTITAPFGEMRGRDGETISTHSGVDVAAPRGTAVRAAGDGEVLVATTWDADRPDAGTFVIIDHGSAIKTYYSHLDTLSIGAGQRVRAGDTIGTVGTTGVSTGPHLHFEVWSAEQPVDPAGVLKK